MCSGEEPLRVQVSLIHGGDLQCFQTAGEAAHPLDVPRTHSSGESFWNLKKSIWAGSMSRSRAADADLS